MGLSTAALAQAAELDHETILRLERGEQDVSFDCLVRMAGALKISVNELTSGT